MSLAQPSWLRRHRLTIALLGTLVVGTTGLTAVLTFLILQFLSVAPYALPDDVPVYPGATLHEGVLDRTSGAVLRKLISFASLTYSLPPGVDPTQVATWYEQEMPTRGWEKLTLPPSSLEKMPESMVPNSWQKENEHFRIAQFLIIPGSNNKAPQLILQVTTEGG